MNGSNDSALLGLLSWVFTAVIAVGIGGAALLWPDNDADWDEIMSSRAPPPVIKPSKAGDTAPLGAGEGDGSGSGGDGEVPVDDEIPVVEVPDTPDPESVLDELPAEGEGLSRTASRPAVGDARVEIVSDDKDWYVHRVVPRETVDQIAFRYGVRPDALRMWNGVRADVVELKPGARVKVHPRKIPPPRRKYEYWVQPGDTWWKIGTSFGVDSRDLRAMNWSSPQRLQVGEKVELWIDPVVYLWTSSEHDPHIPENVRLGAVGIGPPQNGRLVNGVQLPAHPAYSLKLPPSAYGTTHAVAHVVHAMDKFAETAGYQGKLMVGSMSGKHGGPLTPHKSHQSGRDLDIRLPLLADVAPYAPIVPSRVDWRALWKLLEAFDSTGQVVIVFLDYAMQEHLYKAAAAMGVDEERRKQMIQWPRGNKANLGLVRHSPGHEGHIHIRFTCGPNEPECVSEADFDVDAD